ncbi:hypothetical protein M8J75_008537 [Diaphorina citri]|nr:hypothetical protein M8J75_008537 [Diaphorina citri]
MPPLPLSIRFIPSSPQSLPPSLPLSIRLPNLFASTSSTLHLFHPQPLLPSLPLHSSRPLFQSSPLPPSGVDAKVEEFFRVFLLIS